MKSSATTGGLGDASITDEQIEAHDEMLRRYERLIHVPTQCADIERSIARLRNDPARRLKFAKYDEELASIQEHVGIVRDHFAKGDLLLAQSELRGVEIHFKSILRRVIEPDRKRGAKQIAFAREGGKARTTIERDKRLAHLFLQRMGQLGESEKRRKTAVMGKIAKEEGLRVDACRKAIQRGLKTLGKSLRTTRANSQKKFFYAPRCNKASRINMRVLSFPDLKTVKGIPYSRAHVHRLIRAGRFPKPIKLGGPGGHRNVWYESVIDAHLEKLLRDQSEEHEAA